MQDKGHDAGRDGRVADVLVPLHPCLLEPVEPSRVDAGVQVGDVVLLRRLDKVGHEHRRVRVQLLVHCRHAAFHV